MTSLVVGACIVMEAFTWKVKLVQPEYVVLTYPVVYRGDLNGRTVEMTTDWESNWKRSYVIKHAQPCKNPQGPNGKGEGT
jgi:hypothetical protein